MIINSTEKSKFLFGTMKRKIIYVYKKDYTEENGFLKVGDTSVDDGNFDFSDNSSYLKKAAFKRIREYEKTSPITVLYVTLAIDKNNNGFRDYKVHEVLERSGIKKLTKGKSQEWFKTNIQNIKLAIKAVKNNKNEIDAKDNISEGERITFRPNQIECIKQTIKVFKRKNDMLWNAKMRFGKTLTALQVIKELNFKKTLILTHRPIVDEQWFTDFHKIFKPKDNYIYISKKLGEKVNELSSDKSFIFFASMQDLRGSSIINSKNGLDKNLDIFSVDWDLIILDEAQEGTTTILGEKVLNKLTNLHTKVLKLSGTPFNLIGEYDSSQIYTWDYVMEQEAKENWDIYHSGDSNPYSSLPKMEMFVYKLGKIFTKKEFIDLENKSFNFAEFFRTDIKGNFIYKEYVWSFLNLISRKDKYIRYKSNMPFSTEKYRKALRHTLWTMPNIKSAIALEKLLKIHSVFKKYKIANLVNDDNNNSDLSKIKNAITDNPEDNFSITLTVRRGTVGVTVKEWTGILVLNNTESANNYLQSIFRIQSPYNNNGFQKSKSYVFDFAPDRTLKMVAEAGELSPKNNSTIDVSQEDKMKKLLNFLPIIGIDGNKMKHYDVRSMITQLKRSQAERAVMHGFDDDSIYNDSLFEVNYSDLKKFKTLGNLIGRKNETKKLNNFRINKNGLKDVQKKLKKNKNQKIKKSKEEIDALKQINEMKKNRKKLIQILRGISIRIPLMIYGMKSDLNENITIDKFVQEIDDESWKEFMPIGVTKSIFNDFKKYYDDFVFIEAGYRIRSAAISADKLSFEERIDKIASIFSAFRNPDKETVLTPWRVVNIQLGRVIGGYNFYNKNYPIEPISNQKIRYINNGTITKKTFNDSSKIIDINSKTGLYLLYVAFNIYKKRWNKESPKWRKSEWIQRDKQLWQDVLNKNIFAITKTPMAKTITYRTLNGYSINNSFKKNLVYINELTNKIRNDVSKTKNEILQKFGDKNMKFDMIVGNPPYQESDKDDGKGSSKPLYNLFIDLSRKMNPENICLITPSVWFLGGKGLNSFRKSMLEDKHFERFDNYITSKDIFTNVNLRGGVNYFLWNKNYDNRNNGVLVTEYKQNKEISKKIREFNIEGLNLFISDNVGFSIIKKFIKNGTIDINYNSSKKNLAHYVSERNPFGYRTNFNDFEEENKNKNQFKLYKSKGKFGFINAKELKKGNELINKIKVITPFANNIGTDLNDDNLNTQIIGPNEIVTETYLVIGAHLDLDYECAENIEKYLKTKFVRYLISLAKANQNGTRQTYRFVPIQDFTKNSDINWNNNISLINNQLYRKYNINESESKYINKQIK
ncbi:Eco57I restriction-modification methylase domain-containing protein [Apilactobacillus xinyiensis]|uniref:Eco57I restriction-modification methylase domain-containing protein n=1 Tax=Apilactobacillus xinyiensis TaxID=2841032 RepID=UPI003364F828